MTRVLHTCGPQETLQRAAQLMWDHDCGCVPIVDADGRAIGIITDRDIAMTAFLRRRPLDEIRIGEVMSQCLQTCGPSDPVSAAHDVMRRYQLRRVPVTDQLGFLVGLVTLNDLARTARRGTAAARGSSDEVADTLAEVSAHRAAQLMAAE